MRWGKGGVVLTPGRRSIGQENQAGEKGKELQCFCFWWFGPAELIVSGPLFPLNTPPKPSLSQTFPSCLTLTSSGPRDNPTVAKSHNDVPKKLSMSPLQATSGRVVGCGRTPEWEADDDPFPSSSLWSHQKRQGMVPPPPHPWLRVLGTELEAGPCPEQGHRGQKRYHPPTLVDRAVGSGVCGGHAGGGQGLSRGSCAEPHMSQSTLQWAICVCIPSPQRGSKAGEGPWEGGDGKTKACSSPDMTGEAFKSQSTSLEAGTAVLLSFFFLFIIIKYFLLWLKKHITQNSPF